MTFAGIILAAGLSSRMDGFKPLMELGGFSIAEMAVDSMRCGGLSRICVVLGNRAAEVKAAVAGPGVVTVVNERYRETDMYESVKLGLLQVCGADAVFILPVDTPLVAPASFIALKKAMTPEVSVCFAGSFGKPAHPPLISRSCFDKILNYEGGGGLRGALESFSGSVAYCELNDEGALMDADTIEDYEKMSLYARRRKGLSRSMCYALMDEFRLEMKIRSHCIAVAGLAGLMAGRLIECGYGLDLKLIESAALLHDLCRTQEKHAQVAADELEKRGYEAIAGIIKGHMRLEDDFIPRLDEAMVVFLADKMAKRDKFITIEDRYEASLEKYHDPAAARPYVEEQARRCLALKELYERVTTDDLYEQCGNLLPKA